MNNNIEMAMREEREAASVIRGMVSKVGLKYPEYHAMMKSMMADVAKKHGITVEELIKAL